MKFTKFGIVLSMIGFTLLVPVDSARPPGMGNGILGSIGSGQGIVAAVAGLFSSKPLQLGTDSNETATDCVWKQTNTQCPDPMVKMFFHKQSTLLDNGESRLEVIYTKSGFAEAADWIRTSGLDLNKETVVLIHGYVGGDGKLPMVVLRDEYLRNGSYNVLVVDWGEMAKAPCYPAAVRNIRVAAHCAAAQLEFLRKGGLDISRMTCVGHSLGAHTCGLLASYVTFRLHKIIGLDPARPLVRSQNKINAGQAQIVQVVHTNAGFYGEPGKIGTVDFCVNGGRVQPYCTDKENPALCSHVRAVCYLAESISGHKVRIAQPCNKRCPYSSRQSSARLEDPVPIGEQTPNSAMGSFCLHSDEVPFCPSDPMEPGDMRCCTEPDPSQTITEVETQSRALWGDQSLTRFSLN